MKKIYGLSVISVLVLILFVVLALGSGDTTEPEKVEKEDPEVADELFTLGDTVKMGDIVFTVNSARWDKGDTFSEPEKGERWLVIDCTIKNEADKAVNISSMLMFELVDEDFYKRDQEWFVDTKGSLDGELGAGRTMRGEIAFNVEEGQTEWEFIFQPNLFGFGQAIYLITEDDVN